MAYIFKRHKSGRKLHKRIKRYKKCCCQYLANRLQSVVCLLFLPFWISSWSSGRQSRDSKHGGSPCFIAIHIFFAAKVRFQIRDQFLIIQPKLHRARFLDFVCWTSKHALWLVATFWCFQVSSRHIIGSWAQNWFLLNRNYRTRFTCVNLFCA